MRFGACVCMWICAGTVGEAWCADSSDWATCPGGYASRGHGHGPWHRSNPCRGHLPHQLTRHCTPAVTCGASREWYHGRRMLRHRPPPARSRGRAKNRPHWPLPPSTCTYNIRGENAWTFDSVARKESTDHQSWATHCPAQCCDSSETTQERTGTGRARGPGRDGVSQTGNRYVLSTWETKDSDVKQTSWCGGNRQPDRRTCLPTIHEPMQGKGESGGKKII
jgi:hypothetical protein